MISAVVIAKNEEKNIESCLESVKWCDEVIVIDDNSTDKTLEIAKNCNAKIYTHSLNNNFSSQRNYGLSKAKNEWVFFVDADEVVPDALAYEISNAIYSTDQNLRPYNGFYIKRTDFIWGKELKHGETGNIKLLRLARKTKGEWFGAAHERWKVKGLIGKLNNSLKHYPHKTVAEFIKEINYYTDLRASEIKVKNKFFITISVLLYPLGKFIFGYLFKAGFMDGTQGLIFAVIMSFHSFLVRGKLWLLQK